jgi:hypothetical protein
MGKWVGAVVVQQGPGGSSRPRKQKRLQLRLFKLGKGRLPTWAQESTGRPHQSLLTDLHRGARVGGPWGPFKNGRLAIGLQIRKSTHIEQSGPNGPYDGNQVERQSPSVDTGQDANVRISFLTQLRLLAKLLRVGNRHPGSVAVTSAP